MAELARGTVADRPWGRTLGALGLHGLTGQLTLSADGKRYQIAFAGGAVVGAVSPLATDAAVRVALTSGLLSSTQVADIARRQAAAPERDEIDLISELLRIAPDQSMRLRRRAIAQRAARTFAVDRGEFVVDDQITLPVVPGSELDVRSIIYLGARQNLSEARLAGDLERIGGWFRLQPSALEDLPQFAFTEAERPVLERLTDGATLDELETVGVEARVARAMVYALVACNACEIGAGPARAHDAPGKRPARPPPAAGLEPIRPRRPTGATGPVGAAVPRPRSLSQAPVGASSGGQTGRLRPPGNVATGQLRSPTAQLGVKADGAGSRPQIALPTGPVTRPQLAIPPEPGSRPQITIPPGAGGPVTGRLRSPISQAPPPLAGGTPTGRGALSGAASMPPPRRGAGLSRAPRRHANSPLAHEVRALIVQRLKLLVRERGVGVPARRAREAGAAPGRSAVGVPPASGGGAWEIGRSDRPVTGPPAPGGIVICGREPGSGGIASCGRVRTGPVGSAICGREPAPSAFTPSWGCGDRSCPSRNGGRSPPSAAPTSRPPAPATARARDRRPDRPRRAGRPARAGHRLERRAGVRGGPLAGARAGPAPISHALHETSA